MDWLCPCASIVTVYVFRIRSENAGRCFRVEHNNLPMEKHVANICRSAYRELRRISNIRHYLAIDATKNPVCAFVLSKLDYCHSLLSGSPKHLLSKFVKAHSSAARHVCKPRKRERTKPLLQKLHWRPIASRIRYKVSTQCNNSCTETYPV